MLCRSGQATEEEMYNNGDWLIAISHSLRLLTLPAKMWYRQVSAWCLHQWFDTVGNRNDIRPIDKSMPFIVVGYLSGKRMKQTKADLSNQGSSGK